MQTNILERNNIRNIATSKQIETKLMVDAEKVRIKAEKDKENIKVFDMQG